MAQDEAHNTSMTASSPDIACIKPPIATVPPELLEIISANLLSSQSNSIWHLRWARTDLQHLRLVNKAFHDASATPFSTFFKHRLHLVLERSLKTLVEIAEHPVFGPSIETVALGTAVIPREQVTLLKTSSGTSTPAFNTLDEANSIFDFVDRFREYETFINSTQPQNLLDCVFKKLQSYGTRVTIGVYDDGLWQGYGSEDYSDLKHLEDQAFRQASGYTAAERIPGLRTDHRLEMLTSAAKAAQCPLKGLLLDFDMGEYSGASVDDLMRSEEHGLDTALAKILTTSAASTLQDLDIELHSRNMDYKWREDGMVRFAAKERRLELENICVGERNTSHAFFDTRSLNILAPHLQSTRIRCLELRRCPVEVDALRALLAKYQESLTELTLKDLWVGTGDEDEIDAAEGYKALSSWIQTHLSLEHVKINYARPWDEDVKTLDALRCCASGRENVQVALGEHIKMLKEWKPLIQHQSTPESDF